MIEQFFGMNNGSLSKNIDLETSKTHPEMPSEDRLIPVSVQMRLIKFYII